MRLGFQSFTAAHDLPPESIGYADYVMARLLFEAMRDAGLWNLHWNITDQPPNSDRIWKQWKDVKHPSGAWRVAHPQFRDDFAWPTLSRLLRKGGPFFNGPVPPALFLSVALEVLLLCL